MSDIERGGHSGRDAVGDQARRDQLHREISARFGRDLDFTDNDLAKVAHLRPPLVEVEDIEWKAKPRPSLVKYAEVFAGVRNDAQVGEPRIAGGRALVDMEQKVVLRFEETFAVFRGVVEPGDFEREKATYKPACKRLHYELIATLTDLGFDDKSKETVRQFDEWWQSKRAQFLQELLSQHNYPSTLTEDNLEPDDRNELDDRCATELGWDDFIVEILEKTNDRR